MASPNEVDVYFYRHSECVANLSPHIIGGRTNHSPLTPLGEEQAERLGLYIADHIERPDLVYASPAVRTLGTAKIALESAGIQRHIIVDDLLQELSQGEAEGKPRKQIYTPKVFARIEQEGLDFKHPRGQSLGELGKQKLDWLDDTYESMLKDFGVAYVFGHGMAVRSLVGRILGWDYLQIFKASTPNTCITKLHGSAGDWSVEYFAQNLHSKTVTN